MYAPGNSFRGFEGMPKAITPVNNRHSFLRDFILPGFFKELYCIIKKLPFAAIWNML